MQHHKYRLEELGNMMPWEREIYVQMLIEHLKEEIELNKLDLMKKDKEHDNVVRQLVKRLNKMIIAYEKK